MQSSRPLRPPGSASRHHDAIEGEPPPAHAGRFDVGPFVLNLERRDRALWLTSPAPGPSGRLVRIGAASYALDGDPWNVVVHLECPGERCTGMRLHMAGMEWPGRLADR